MKRKLLLSVRFTNLIPTLGLLLGLTACLDTDGDLEVASFNSSIDATTKLSTSCEDNQILQASGGSLVCANPSNGTNGLGGHTATQNLDLAAFQLVGNGGASGVSIASNGNVGIGTTSPDSTFDVNGVIELSGAGRSQISNADAVGREILRLRAEQDNTLGAGIDLYGNGDASYSGEIKLFNSNTATMTLDANNNVGIGTENPSRTLNVVSDSSNTVAAFERSDGGGGNIISLSATNSSGVGSDGTIAQLQYTIETETEGVIAPLGALRFVAEDATQGTVDSSFAVITLKDGISSNSLYVNEDGEVGIGTTNPDTAFHVVGNATVEGSGGTCVINGSGACSSDERLKNKISKVDKDVFEKLHQIDGWLYHWNETTVWDRDQVHMGVMAQDVNSVFPAAVEENEIMVIDKDSGEKVKRKRFMVKYDRLVVPLIEASKQLDERVKALDVVDSEQDAEIAALKAENAKLKERISNIEKVLESLAVKKDEKK